MAFPVRAFLVCLVFITSSWHFVQGTRKGFLPSNSRLPLFHFQSRFPRQQQQTPPPPPTDIIQLGQKVIKRIDELWSLIREDMAKIDIQPVNRKKFLFNRLHNHIKAKIEDLEKRFNVYLVGSNMFRFHRRDIRLIPGAPEWAKTSEEIWSLYQKFTQEFLEPTNGLAGLTHFVSEVNEAIQSALEKLKNNEGRSDIYKQIKTAIRGDQYICSMDQSPHQLLYNLYNVIALSEIKGYAMIQFSYMILELDSERNYTVESDRAKSAFEKQAKEKLQIVTGILKSISTNFWKCDPLNHKETQTYIRMTQLLQGIIENEADIHPDGSCKNECSDFTTGFEVLRCTKDRVCSHQNRCEGGRVYDCQFHDRDADVCFSSDPTRRYDYVKYEDGTVLGKYDRCMNGKKHKVDSWWRFPYHCSMCVCKCDAEGPESDRYWSLKPLTADLDQGKVVIGVRFVKRNRVIQMDIMQAQALPEGSVNETTKAWKLAPPVDIQKASPKELFTMNYKVRDLDLDVLEVPTGSVVTGIRFRDLGGHVNLEIQATPIQFANGSLKTDQSVWIGNDNTPASTTPRRYLHIIQPDVPIRNRLSTIVSENNQFIRFDTSDVHKDAMQSTIPYIDAQPVTTYPGTWLSGLGLYYKGRNGYGGFVGPMIQTFNFSEHLLPKEDKPETFDMEAMKSERHVRVLSRQRLHA